MSHEIMNNTYSITTPISFIESDLEEYADRNGDSGGLSYGFTIPSITFNSVEECEKYIDDNDRSYKNFICKTWKKPPKSEKTYLENLKKIEEIESQIEKLGNVIDTFKSAMISCKECGSKISVKAMKAHHKGSDICPVCSATFICETTRKRIENLDKKILALNEKIRKWEKDHDNCLMYLTKIEFHS